MPVATTGREAQIPRKEAPTPLCIFGVSTPLLHAAVSFLKSALEGAGGLCALVAANTVAGVRDGLAASRSAAPTSIIFTSDSPDDETVEVFLRSGARMIVAAEDFVDSAVYLRGARGLPTPEALRFLTQTLSTLAPFLTAEGVLLLHLRYADEPLAVLLGHVFDLIGWHDLDIEAALRYANVDRDDTLRSYAATHFPSLAADPPSAHELTTIRALSTSYQQLVHGQKMAAAFWPTELFLDWGQPGCFLRGPIDLTGPARFIVCGPYLHLPIGRWRARFVVRVGKNLSGNRLSLDIFAHEVLAGVTTQLPAKGLYAFDVVFDIRRAYVPLEARIQIQQGAIEGVFEFVGVDFLAF